MASCSLGGSTRFKGPNKSLSEMAMVGDGEKLRRRVVKLVLNLGA